MECPRCHEELVGRLRFCPTCGLLVEELMAEEDAAEESIEDAEPEDAEPDEDEPSDEDAAPQEQTSAAEGDGSESAPEDEGDDEGAREAATDEPADEQADERQLDEEDLPDARGEDPYAEADPYVVGALRMRVAELLAHWQAVAITLAVVVALVVASGSCAAAKVAEGEAAAQAAAERKIELSTSVELPVQVNAAGYDETHASPIPLRVAGKTELGEVVDELVLVGSHDAALSLLPGTYEVSAAGAPVTEEGRLYEASVDTYALVVGAKEVEVNGQKATEDEPASLLFVFNQVAPENVTDAQVEAVRAWMEAAGVQESQAYIDAVLRLRQETLDRQAQEQVEREQQELQAVQDATRKAQEAQEAQKDKDKDKDADGDTDEQEDAYGYDSAYDNEYGYEEEPYYADEEYGW